MIAFAAKSLSEELRGLTYQHRHRQVAAFCV